MQTGWLNDNGQLVLFKRQWFYGYRLV
ncbi:hypothetical protein OEG88_02545 [Clostridium perfringens]|nr:hypothetical protein OEG88_02545 [Clostridium perfringens]